MSDVAIDIVLVREYVNGYPRIRTPEGQHRAQEALARFEAEFDPNREGTMAFALANEVVSNNKGISAGFVPEFDGLDV